MRTLQFEYDIMRGWGILLMFALNQINAIPFHMVVSQLPIIALCERFQKGILCIAHS